MIANVDGMQKKIDPPQTRIYNVVNPNLPREA